MKTTELRILVASALLFMTASAQALQPEVLYAFQLEPTNPSGLVQGSDGDFYGTIYSLAETCCSTAPGQPMELIVFGPAQICRCRLHPGRA